MKRQFVTRKKFYDIRRAYKHGISGWTFGQEDIAFEFDVSVSTIRRVLIARNFKEYKASGSIYGKGVKVLRLRYMFILFIIAIMAMFINLLTK